MSFFDQMKDLGYEDHNSLRLLGSLFIFAMLYFVRILVWYPLVLAFSKLFGVGKQYAKNLRNKLFFNELLIINIEAFFELIISAYINYHFSLSTTNGEKAA